MKVRRGEPIDLTTGHVNVVWQTDANRVTLKSFDLAASPPAVLNVSGPKAAVRDIAAKFGEAFGKEPIFTGQEAQTALLNCGDACWRRYGQPEATLDYMIQRIADWIMAGYLTWQMPTHFESREGAF
jgi:nucleoside-diphosphate-sugar epimerase